MTLRRSVIVGALALVFLAAGRFDAHTAGAPPFVRGRLVCAVNTGRWLALNGFRHTASWSSKSYLEFRRVSRAAARFGDVRFNFRKGGGHVQPVIGWRGRVLWCQNPSSRRGWVRKACPAGGVFVRPGRR